MLDCAPCARSSRYINMYFCVYVYTHTHVYIYLLRKMVGCWTAHLAVARLGVRCRVLQCVAVCCKVCVLQCVARCVRRMLDRAPCCRSSRYVNMYFCVYVYTHSNSYMYTPTWTPTRLRTLLSLVSVRHYVFVCISTYVFTNANIYAAVYTPTGLRALLSLVSVRQYVVACMHVYMYASIYLHTYIQIGWTVHLTFARLKLGPSIYVCLVLKGVAGCCRVLQGVAGCCSALQFWMWYVNMCVCDQREYVCVRSTWVSRS